MNSVNVEQEQTTFSVELDGRYFSVIRTYNVNQSYTNTLILEEGEPIEDVSLIDKIEEFMNSKE
jgi:hypothetical protein